MTPDRRRRLLLAAGVTLAVAALVGRTFTSGGGLEVQQPGTQLLLDWFALLAAVAVVAADAVVGQAPFRAAGLAAPATAVFVGVAALSAASASHADLAWRTACTWFALLALGLTVRELAEDRRLARWLAALAVACVVLGATLGVHDAFVARPAQAAALESGALDAELAVLGRGAAIAMRDRIRAVAAVGPWLLPNLLATAICAALPLVLVGTWRNRRRPIGAACGVALAVLLVALVATRSKGGAVTAGVVATAGLLLSPLEPRRRRQLLVGVGVVAALVGAAGVALFVATPEAEGVGLSLTVRLEYWRAGLAMAAEHPLLGVGLNQFREYYPALKPLRAEETVYAHNAVVQVLADEGLAGLTALALLTLGWGWAGVVEAVATPGDPGEATEEPGGPSLLDRAWAARAGLAGVAVIAVILAGFGDVVSAATPGALAVVVLGLPLVGAAFAHALGASPGRDPVLAAAAVAGAAALAGDGLLDFGLHHAGAFGVAVVLAAVAPGLAGRPSARPVSLGVRWGLAGAVALAAVAVGGVIARGALSADVDREVARVDVQRALNAWRAGEVGPAASALADGLAGFDAALAGYPWHVRTHVARAQALELAATLADRRAGARKGPSPAPSAEGAALRADAEGALRRALELAPRAYGVWNELGLLLLEGSPPPWEAAVSALDRAVDLYPGNPALLLDAARARVAWLGAAPADAGASARRAEALELLARAERASAATRLERARLDAEAQAEVARLRARLQ